MCCSSFSIFSSCSCFDKFWNTFCLASSSFSLLSNLASYQGTTSTGKIKEVFGINEDLTNRTVIIVEDIVESGLTMKQMIESLGTRNPASIHICTLFFKPSKLKENINPEYVAFSIPDDFILGYGLDYDQQGRGLKDVYTIID